MSKVVALGEPDDLVALVAAGIEVRPCRTARELEAELEALTEAALVLVSESAAEMNPEALEEARSRRGLRLLVIPTLGSHRRLAERSLSRLLEEAAGADLLARETESYEKGVEAEREGPAAGPAERG